MISLTRKNLPCWYELSWQEEVPAILLRVHQDFIKNAKPIRMEIVSGLVENLKLSNFIGSFEGNFGFNNAFQRIGEKDGFVEFLIKIPQVKKTLEQPCQYCKGTGEDKFFKRNCSFCDGGGKQTVHDWEKTYEISASFTVFTMMSYYNEKETSCPLPQLFTLRTITRKEMHGGSLSGVFSKFLVDWLRSEITAKRKFSGPVQAMKVAYSQMLGQSQFFDFLGFGITLDDNGWFVMDCPGDACGIYPEGHYGENEGYEFSCHNVDSPVQQLTLISGLAALHDMARKNK